ncbi:MAG: SpoIIE family protein phosphatase [Bacteroidales bacterium]|nr:SpoIIE family protein phosphatase [Bacteroidales bacterium]
MHRYILSILLMLALSMGSAFSQKGKADIDSLENLAASVGDSLRIGIYNELSMLYRHFNPGRGMDYASKAIYLSEQLNNPEMLAKSYFTLAISERNLDMEMKALEHFQKVLSIARYNDLDDMIGQACNNVARMHLVLNNLDSVQPYIIEAWEVADETRDLNTLSYVFLNSGIMYSKSGNLDSAITLLKASYVIRHDSLGISTDFLMPLCHLSDIYVKKKDYAKAKDCLNMCLSNKGFSQWDFFHSKIWLMLASIYYKEGRMDSAEYATQKSVEQSLNCKNLKCLELAYKLLDSIYLSTGDYQKASEACSSFMDLNDTLYNKFLEEQLSNIQHTTNYIANNQTLNQSKSHRQVVFIILASVALALLAAIPFIAKIIRSNRRINQLNKDMGTKRLQLMNGLNNTYALQMALQPTNEELGEVFLEMFLLYMPRYVVSGDFFWKQTAGEYEIIAVADCAGHGMPGAMLTMLGICTINDIVAKGETRADVILEKLRERIKSLMSTNALNKMTDVMDISLVSVHRKTMTMEFAGACNSLFYTRNGKMYRLSATPCAIGDNPDEPEFASQKLELRIGDCIYMMTDGYWSQLGGPDKTKMQMVQFLDILLSIHQKSMNEQKEILETFYREWQGANEQVDDVTVVGFRV